MLFKEQAKTTANTQGQRKVAPVTWICRCQALFFLAPSQRSPLVQQASRTVSQKSLFFFITFAWIGASVLFWLYGMSETNRRQFMVLFIFGSSVLPLCLRAFLIRRELRKLAAQQPRFS